MGGCGGGYSGGLYGTVGGGAVYTGGGPIDTGWTGSGCVYC